MESDPNETLKVFLSQVLTGIHSASERQSQLFLRALERTSATSASREKRSDIPWPTFSGEPGENVRTWLRKMEFAFEAHKTAGEDKVVHAALCLKDKASEWFMQLARIHDGKPFNDWAGLAREALERFEPEDLQYQLRGRLREIKQDTTLDEYISRFHNLLSQVDNMAEVDKVAFFTDGLKTNLRYEVGRQGPQTLKAAIRLAESTYNALRVNGLLEASPWSVASPRVPAKVEPTAMEIDNLERRSWNSDADSRRCYNCQGIGHIARQCPSPRMTSGRGGRPAPRATRPPHVPMPWKPSREKRSASR